MKSLWDARRKILGMAAIALLLLLMMNLNSRLSEYFHLSSERDNMSTQVNEMRQTKAALETQVAYATSDQAVEDWARNEAHMARPGDKVIIPVPDGAATPIPIEKPTPTPPPAENWEIWWALFFGE